MLLGLGWVLVMFNTVRAIQSNASMSSRLVGVAIPLALAFTLFAGAIGITYYGLHRHAFRIATWTVLGTTAVTIAVVLNIVGFDIVQPDYQLSMFMVVNAAAGGAVLGFLVGVYDAQQQALNDDLKQETERARALSQRLSVINRVLRHDTRNQAQIIQSHTEKLQRGEEDTATAVAKIQQANDRLAELSDEARELQALLSGAETKTTRLDVVTLVRGAGSTVREVHPDLAVEHELPEEQAVYASPLLEQAIEHLLYNAVEHNDAEQPAVTIRVRVEPEQQLPVELSIADNGPGIPEDEPVHDAEFVETELHHSSGVGLWFVRWIVEDTGGTCDIETPDDPDIGTVIRLRLPDSP